MSNKHRIHFGSSNPHIRRPIIGKIGVLSSKFSRLVRGFDSFSSKNYPFSHLCIGMTIPDPIQMPSSTQINVFFSLVTLLIYHMVSPLYFRSIRCAWLNFRSNTWNPVNLETEWKVLGSDHVTGHSAEETWKRHPGALYLSVFQTSLPRQK